MVLSRDTSREAERVQMALLRRMNVAKKMRMLSDLIEAGRGLAMGGLRRRHPEATSEELVARYFRLMLGEDLGECVLAARRARGLRN